MNQRNQIKIIAASLCAAVSMQVLAGLGGLQVQSGLGEPFSGSIVVTGEEARLLLSNNGAAVITGAPLRATVVRQGDNAVLRLRSSQAIQEPLLSFGLVVGGQGRQYSAIMDPPNYRVRAATPPATSADGRRDAAKAAVSAALQDAGQQSARAQTNAAASVFSGQRYTVQPQENLIDVARKVQPQGLTLGQTMRALVKANPRAFRNGNPDLMYKNVTLRIPSAEQMRTLARQPISRPAPTVGAAPTTAPEAPAAGMAATPEPTAPASAAVSTPADAQTTVAEASAPVAASEPLAASAVMASEAEAASAVVAAPVAPPPPPPTPVVEPEPQAGFLDGLWPYILGGGGLLLLLALLLLLRRRQQARADEAEEAADEVVLADEPVRADPSYAVAAAAAAPVNNEDDDIVFADIEQQIKTVETPTQARMAVEPSPAPAAKPTAAQANEWAWLDDAATAAAQPATSSKAALSNDDGWLDEQTFDEKEFSPTVPESVSPEPVAARAAPADDDWLQFDAAEVAAPATAVTVAAAQPPAAEEAVDDWSWFEESALAEVSEPEPVVPAPIAETPTAPAVEAEVAEISLDEAFASDDFEWQVDPASQANSQANTGNETPLQSLAGAATPADKALADAVADIDLDVDLLSWDDEATTSPAVEPQPSPSVAASVDAIEGMEDLSWDDGMDVALDYDEPKAAHGHKSSDPGDDARQRHAFAAADQDLAVADIDWGALGLTDDGGNQAAASQGAAMVEADIFAVETEPVPMAAKPAVNVNLSVPLEAKLELAQMYLEIDDAQTARKTLQELITEADGEILAEAKSLLAQLGD
ncbi:FimV/HubP family polar landmark protein [Paralysiella testudinis]|uniref:Pilus assembly protein FimV n=1 Tax=Paralysiella testudinis TaxID=2809020 RepID=A0A892ZG80_9NEIS|nr:FimV/HubP family polar landmark protein [Paralysiella testudinis]QRQ80746.1 hypothetical protein JQU52_08220 [Paralysiella testudinis]